MRVPIERVERIVLSHWHSDHSGGILSFLRLRRDKIESLGPNRVPFPGPCIADLHPDRPIARGLAPTGKVIGQLNRDPTFEEIEGLGGVVEKHAEGHAVAGDTVWVSGEIPRLTSFEQGLLGAVRFVGKEGSVDGEWISEEVRCVLWGPWRDFY